VNRWTKILCLTVLATGCAERPADGVAESPPPAVRVAVVTPAALGNAVRAIGMLAPKDEARLAFKTGGVIEAIRVEAGETVRAGQLLAWLRQTEVEAAVRHASEVAAKAQRDLERGRALYADGVTTEEQVQDLNTAASVADAALESARFNARFARIEAPADGIVLRRLADPDELVASGQPVLVVGGTRRGWVVKAALADRDIVKVHVGDRAGIELDAFPGRRHTATVATVGSAADPLTGTFEIELLLDGDEPRFAQGMVARVTLVAADAKLVPAVPVGAIIEADDRRAFVYVHDRGAGTVRRTAIGIGRFVGGQVEITSGVAVGDPVVIDGAAFLHDGARVRVQP